MRLERERGKLWSIVVPREACFAFKQEKPHLIPPSQTIHSFIFNLYIHILLYHHLIIITGMNSSTIFKNQINTFPQSYLPYI